jgi:hypothetical protein
MPSKALDERDWLERAREARFQADQLTTPDAKRIMLEIAACYQRLAQYAEERMAGTLFNLAGGLSTPCAVAANTFVRWQNTNHCSVVGSVGCPAPCLPRCRSAGGSARWFGCQPSLRRAPSDL